MNLKLILAILLAVFVLVIIGLAIGYAVKRISEYRAKSNLDEADAISMRADELSFEFDQARHNDWPWLQIRNTLQQSISNGKDELADTSGDRNISPETREALRQALKDLAWEASVQSQNSNLTSADANKWRTLQSQATALREKF